MHACMPVGRQDPSPPQELGTSIIHYPPPPVPVAGLTDPVTICYSTADFSFFGFLATDTYQEKDISSKRHGPKRRQY